jgi:hypothetical protein
MGADGIGGGRGTDGASNPPGENGADGTIGSGTRNRVEDAGRGIAAEGVWPAASDADEGADAGDSETADGVGIGTDGV